jgi:hypothetical protein
MFLAHKIYVGRRPTISADYVGSWRRAIGHGKRRGENIGPDSTFSPRKDRGEWGRGPDILAPAIADVCPSCSRAVFGSSVYRSSDPPLPKIPADLTQPPSVLHAFRNSGAGIEKLPERIADVPMGFAHD